MERPVFHGAFADLRSMFSFESRNVMPALICMWVNIFIILRVLMYTCTAMAYSVRNIRGREESGGELVQLGNVGAHLTHTHAHTRPHKHIQTHAHRQTAHDQMSIHGFV